MIACVTSCAGGARCQDAVPEALGPTGLRASRRAAATTRAPWPAAVCSAMNPVGKPDAGNRHVRFDERGEETERCRMAQVTAPLLDSTRFIRATAKRGSERNYSSFFGSFDMRS